MPVGRALPCSGSLWGPVEVNHPLRPSFEVPLQFREKDRQQLFTLRTVNDRTGGDNNEYRGDPGGPDTGFCSPGGGFSGTDMVARHYGY